MIIGEGLDVRDMGDGWETGTRQDGGGYHFTASKARPGADVKTRATASQVLWAFGWIRCNSEEYARAEALRIGKNAEAAAQPGRPVLIPGSDCTPRA